MNLPSFKQEEDQNMTAIARDKLNLNKHILTILQNCKNIKQLNQLQSHLITLGHAQTQFFSFKLVRHSILSLSNLPHARSIFDSLTSPNVYLYTAIITAYASLSDHHSALLMYRHMVRNENTDTKPNQFIYPHVFKCCNANLIHTQIIKSGFGNYPVVQTSLLDSYWRYGSDYMAARKVFDEMPERTIVTWTAMISGYARVGKMGDAILIFEGMVERDTPSWNAVIAGSTQNGLFPEAISLFRRMVVGKNEDIRPNTVTLVCVLSACGNTGMLHLGKSIHGYVYRNGVGPDRFVSNALVDMYGKCGNLLGARRVYDITLKKGLTLLNSMINSFALHGHSEEAISVFEEMILCDNGVKPDNVTFVGVLNACTHGGLVNQGRAYFKSMINDFKIEPQIQHYGCLIDLLVRAGKFDEAMKVIKEMRVSPDEVVWGSLLNGCKIYSRIDLAELAAKKLVEIDPSNGGYGIMLANIYVEMGKWEEVGKLRKMLKDTDAHKTPGCSWIEVNNRVHQFYSVDTTHPRTEEIYTVLESLLDFFQ